MNKRSENKAYLSEQIITYLGNKRTLIDLIEKEIKLIQKQLVKSKTINLDLFSGSGIVARMLKQYSSLLIVNDLELYSEIINKAYLINDSEINWDIYEGYRSQINKKIEDNDLIEGIISKYYAPADDSNINAGERVFYTTKNARIIDTVRCIIEDFNEPYKTLFLAQLLAEASVKNNTAGVFKGFYKDAKTGIGKYGGTTGHALSRIKADIEILRPVTSNFECDYLIYRKNANNLVKELSDIDIAYIDPPYNQHPYASNYFMLNLIVQNTKPENISKVSGIPRDWNKSAYNSKAKALLELDDLLSNLDAKFIIISYNSEGFISYQDMITLLKKYGEFKTKKIKYNTYRGCRNLANRNIYVSEYLFILDKRPSDHA